MAAPLWLWIVSGAECVTNDALSIYKPILKLTMNPDPRSVWNVPQAARPALTRHDPGFYSHSDLALGLTNAKRVSLLASGIHAFVGATPRVLERDIEHLEVYRTPFGSNIAALFVENADCSAL